MAELLWFAILVGPSAVAWLAVALTESANPGLMCDIDCSQVEGHRGPHGWVDPQTEPMASEGDR